MPSIITFGSGTVKGYGATSAVVAVAVGITIVIVDPYFYRTTAALNGETASTSSHFLADISTNKFVPTVNGSVTPNRFSPLWGSGYYGVQFDGSTSYLTTPSNSVFTYGTGDFTFEFWVYFTSYSTANQNIVDTRTGSGDTTNWSIYLENVSGTGTKQVRFNSVNADRAVSASNFPLNCWNHIALSRVSSTTRFFINGVQQGSNFSDSTNYTSTVNYIGYYQPGGTAFFNGYLSNMRGIKGTGLYSANFIPPTSPLTAVTGTNVLTCLNSNFSDSSTNNFTITVAGTTKIITNQPFGALPSTIPASGSGYYSARFDGSTGYLNLSSPSQLAFGTSNFTIEFWIYANSWSSTPTIYDARPSGGNGLYPCIYATTGGQITFYINTTNVISGTAINLYTWYHIALVKNSTSTILYINGFQSGSTYTDTNTYLNGASAPVIGGNSNVRGSQLFNGYISNLRVATVAVYTSAFIPSTLPLTATTGTALLTLTSSTFVDLSTNGSTITVTGSVTTSTSNPFPTLLNPIQTYGSGLFDGTTGYLTVFYNTVFDWATAAYTIEFWAYPTALATYKPLCSKASGTTNDWEMLLNSSGNVIFRYWTGSNQTFTSSSTIPANAWSHIAFTYNGSTTLALYINGAAAGTFAYVATASATAATLFQIGGAINGLEGASEAYFSGYISNFRVVKGTAVYTTAFTPPTSPLTAITNTALLTLQTKQHYNNNIFYDESSFYTPVTRAGLATQGSFSPFSQGGWSHYFPGDYNFYYFPYNTAYNLASNNFTIEAWVCPMVRSASWNTIVCEWNSSPSNHTFLIALSTTGYLNFEYNGASYTASSGPVALGTWAHIAVTQVSSVVYLYVNGTQVGSVTPGAAIGSGEGTSYLTVGINYEAYAVSAAGWSFNGYISNLRIVNGTALYTGTSFAVPTAPLTTVTNTVLLTANSNRFQDFSTITSSTVFVNTPIVTPVSPFTPGIPYNPVNTGGSIYVSGTTTGDWAVVNPSAASLPALNVIGGKYTIECWVYPLAFASNNFVIMQDDGSTSNVNFQFAYNSSGIFYYLFFYSGARGSNTQINSVNALQKNAWNHLAATYDGTTTRTYLNGVYQASSTQAYTWTGYPSIQTVIGNYTSATGLQTTTYGTMNAYVSNVRITKGAALYTGATNFTVPTAPFTPVHYYTSSTTATTSLLLAATNAAMVDQSARFNVVTVNTATTVLNSSVVKYGSGSYKFNGTTDYAYAASTVANPIFAFGTSDFTIECWVYLVAYSTNTSPIYDGRALGQTSFSTVPCLMLSSTGAIEYATGGSSVVITGSTLSTSTWYHVAVARASSTTRLFLNGVQQSSSYSDSQSYISNVNRPIFGTDASAPLTAGFCLNGYIDDLRVTQGYARYTSAFTPPNQSNPVQ